MLAHETHECVEASCRLNHEIWIENVQALPEGRKILRRAHWVHNRRNPETGVGHYGDVPGVCERSKHLARGLVTHGNIGAELDRQLHERSRPMRYLAVGAGRVPYDWTAVVEGEQCGSEPIPSRMVYIRQGRLVSRSNKFIEPDQMTAADNHPVERGCDFWQFYKRSDFVGPPGRRFFEIRKSLEVYGPETIRELSFCNKRKKHITIVLHVEGAAHSNLRHGANLRNHTLAATVDGGQGTMMVLHNKEFP